MDKEASSFLRFLHIFPLKVGLCSEHINVCRFPSKGQVDFSGRFLDYAGNRDNLSRVLLCVFGKTEKQKVGFLVFCLVICLVLIM